MQAIKEAEARKQKQLDQEEKIAKDELKEKELEIQQEIQAVKDENAQTNRNIQDAQRERDREAADEIKRLEEEKRKDKEETAAMIKKLEEEQQAIEQQGKKDLETAEEQYQQKRTDLLTQYRQAVGEAHNDIIQQGDSTWSSYASNAISHLSRVEAAARQAAAAANAGGGNGKWTGGPVSGGQAYTVNELGQEAFLSKSGQLSLINAPKFGTWRPKESGTVLNAAVTSKLGLPSNPINLGRGVDINHSGGTASSSATGNETTRSDPA